MGKNYLKVVFREIQGSFGRFIAITAIVALGVGFLVGILSTTPDMRASADKSYKDKNVLDIFIKSNMGFTDDDVSELKNNIDEIKDISPIYSLDTLIKTSNDESLVSRIYGLDLDNLDKENIINKVTLVEGRLPKNENEVLVQKAAGERIDFELGTNLNISKENKDYENTIKNYNVNEFEVVGVVENSFYYSADKEPSTEGTGKLDTIIYGFNEIFNLEAYTDIEITLKKSKNLESFTKEYEDYVEDVVEKIEELSKRRVVYRDEEIKGEAYKEINKGKEALREEQEKVYNELNDAKKYIDDGYLQIEESRKEIKNGYEEISKSEEKLNKYLEELLDNEDKLNEGNKDYLEGKEKLDAGKDELDKAKSTLDEALNKLNFGEDGYNQIINSITTYETKKDVLEKSLQEVNSKINELNNSYDLLISLGNLEEASKIKTKIENLKSNIVTIEENLTSLEEAIPYLNDKKEETKKELDLGWQEYNLGFEEYKKHLKEYETNLNILENSKKEIDEGLLKISEGKIQIEKAKKEIALNKGKLVSGEKEIEEALKDLESGKNEYNEGLEKANKEFKKAEKEIENAIEEVKEIEKSKWYVLDRNSNVSYVSYKLNTQKVADIANVFPIFFFIVAGLVTLTTMTRMVEEERLQIGVFKALGFTKAKILFKYIAYCGIATVTGCFIGLLAGFSLLPIAIYSAYKFNYILPKLVLTIHWKYALIACILEIAATIGVTYFATMQSMKEKPSSLMVAKAPKIGKRIFLERLGFIWKKMSFSYKATARNIFRNKKNLIMTMTGIAGCTALMVAAFGIKDSIGDVVTRQFDYLQKYDMKIEYNLNKQDEILNNFIKDKNYLNIYSENVVAIKGKDRVNLNLYVPEDLEKINEFINLENRKSKEKIKFEKNSVILTEKAADILDIKVNDVIEIEGASKDKYEFKVTKITENYIGSYIYMDYDLYKEAFKEANSNMMILNSGIKDEVNQDEVIKELLTSNVVSSVEFTSSTRETYDSLISSLNMIVIVLIGVAGALAITVLYNIINVNVNERIKELATLRVLGFHHEEVDKYIFREIRIMVLMGIIVGLGLGFVLHRYIILVADTAELMFGRIISPLSYGLSALATVIFAEVVRLIMLKKIKRIKMAESMKSVD